jgi:hypothetical protein
MKGTSTDREVKARYRAFIREKNMRMFRIIAILELLFLPLFAAIDCACAGMPVAAIPLRALPLPLAAAILIITVRRGRLIGFFTPLFNAFLLANTIMLCGLMVLSMRTPYFSDYATGLMVAAFLILALSHSGLKVLLPVYLAPVFPSFAYMMHVSQDPQHQPVLLNAGVLLLASLAGGWLMERLRFTEFSSGLSLEAKQRELDTEMELARRVQQNIIPQGPPDYPHCRVCARYLPVREMGGDFYDFLNFKDRRALGIFISDVSGHGFHSALITSMLKSLLVTSGINRLSPKRLLDYLNNALKSLVTEHFITAFYGILDNETRNLTFARAGHPYPLLVRGPEITQLKSRGAPLGPFVDGGYEEERITMLPGDKVLFYTDGLIEVSDPAGTIFEPRLHEIIREHSGEGIGEMIESIQGEMLVFRGTEHLPDDICMVGIEILDGNAGSPPGGRAIGPPRGRGDCTEPEAAP